jgi:hypothetical protein
MVESYMLLSQVLRAFKDGHELPEWFQTFARSFAGDLSYFVSLDLNTNGGVLANRCQEFYAAEGVLHYVGAVVSCTRVAVLFACMECDFLDECMVHTCRNTVQRSVEHV